jgi:hypothetical protein
MRYFPSVSELFIHSKYKSAPIPDEIKEVISDCDPEYILALVNPPTPKEIVE